ncbi:MAG: glycoside hydrolase family 18 [Muribaculaceae bacterium]
MKAIKYLLALMVGTAAFVSCDTDIENKEIEKPFTYSDLYYQNLRDYKNSDHSIAFGWFNNYSMHSGACRFSALPDSIDIISLWGGIPSPDKDKDIYDEFRFVQKVKGTKMLTVHIVRIDAESDKEDFKQAYLAAKAMPAGEEREAALLQAIEMYADTFINSVFLNDLDGFDADFEPEGDFLNGDYFVHFMKYIGQYMGPSPDITKEERLALIRERFGDEMANQEGICDKLLCVDGSNSTKCEPYCDYFFQQAYSGSTSLASGWPTEKCVLCCNMGDKWSGTMQEMYNQARYQPSTGRKGGFGAFIIGRDYNVHENNPSPYFRTRECIQIQNPAVY